MEQQQYSSSSSSSSISGGSSSRENPSPSLVPLHRPFPPCPGLIAPVSSFGIQVQSFLLALVVGPSLHYALQTSRGVSGVVALTLPLLGTPAKLLVTYNNV